MESGRKGRRRWAMAAAVLAAGCTGGIGARHWQPRPRVDLEVQREDWKYAGLPGAMLVTPHYRIHTTCLDPLVLDTTPKVLEACFDAYQQVVPGKLTDDQPMRTYLFAQRGQWEAFTRKFGGPRAETYLKIRSGGYEQDGVTVVHYATRGITLRVLAHEGLHQFLTATGRHNVPAWLNEGLACYFESFSLSAAGWPVFMPKQNTLRLPHLRRALRQDKLIPLGELLAMDAAQAVWSGEEKTKAFYAQVWALVVYLMEPSHVNPDAIGFQRLLSELGTEQMEDAVKRAAEPAGDSRRSVPRSEAVFRYYISNDLDGFSERFEAFAQKLAE